MIMIIMMIDMYDDDNNDEVSDSINLFLPVQRYIQDLLLWLSRNPALLMDQDSCHQVVAVLNFFSKLIEFDGSIQ